MADKHPYVSAPGNLIQVVTHFRRSFPTTVRAETLRKLGFAPKNESYVLNVLRFVGLIDQEGKKTDVAAKTFNVHEDAAFSQAFAELVKSAYSDLFELHGEGAWGLDVSTLITFFRSTDDTTAIVGKRQATTFQLLAAFSGHGDLPVPKAAGAKPAAPSPKAAIKKSKAGDRLVRSDRMDKKSGLDTQIRNFGLTVRVEINLPADGDQDTYDRIFRSIRDNLLND